MRVITFPVIDTKLPYERQGIDTQIIAIASFTYTERFLSSLIALISILRLPMIATRWGWMVVIDVQCRLDSGCGREGPQEAETVLTRSENDQWTMQ